MSRSVVCGGHRRRQQVSLSSGEPSGEPVGQLDRAVELIHGATRGLSESALSRDELSALAGLLTQISGALLTFTDLLVAPVHHYDRLRSATATSETAGCGQAVGLLRECRQSYQAAGTSAREFHAQIRR